LVADEGQWFFTMEIVEGRDFISYVRPQEFDVNEPWISTDTTVAQSDRNETGDTSVPLDEYLQYQLPSPEFATTREFAHVVDEAKLRHALGKLVGTLDELHRLGLVHQDLKPSNVLVTDKGRVVLMDFGVVAVARAPREIEDELIRGTPTYMAPEQITGGMATPAADWYALGVMLYQALTGRVPFSGSWNRVREAKLNLEPPPICRFCHAPPDDLYHLCRSLLSRQAAHRPSGETILSRLGLVPRLPSISEGSLGKRIFVGRKTELAVLHRAMEASNRMHTVVALIRGPSGMGKSTLVRRFLHEVEATADPHQTPIILKGRCHQRETMPYKAFDPIIDDLCRELEGLKAEHVARLLPERIGILLRLFPILRRASGIPSVPAEEPSDPDELRRLAFAALRELLCNLGSVHPMIVYVDDLQWADRDSLELLKALTRGANTPPCLLICTLSATQHEHIEETVGPLLREHQSRVINISPLEPDEQEAMVLGLLGEEINQTEPFWTESDGNPLFLTEMARYVRDRDESLPRGTSLRLRDVLLDRFSRLHEAARLLLQLAAIAGTATPLWVLGTAASLSHVQRERAFAMLRGASLVRVAMHGHEPWIQPYHDRIQRTIIETASESEFLELHTNMALALERWEGAAAHAMARHWAAAKRPQAAAQYLVTAAAEAFEKLAFDRAAELYAEAIETSSFDGEKLQTLLRSQAKALASAGRHYEAAVTYRQAAQVATSVDKARMLRFVAENLLRCGRIDEGLKTLAEALEGMGEKVPLTHAQARRSLIWRRIQVTLRGLEFTERDESDIAARHLEWLDTLHATSSTLAMLDHIRGGAVQARHLLAALQFGEPKRAYRALAMEATFLATANSSSAGRAGHISQMVTKRAQKMNDPYLYGVAAMARGSVAFWVGHFNEAAVAFQEAERIARDDLIGAEWERITSRYFYCMSHINMGSYNDAAEAVTRFVDDAQRRRDAYAANLFRTQPSCWRLLRADMPEEALEQLEGALAGWPPDAHCLAHHFECIARAVVHNYSERYNEAKALLVGALPMMKANMIKHIPLLMLEYHMHLGRVCLGAGDHRLAKKSMRFLYRYGTEVSRGLSLMQQATLESRLGHNGRAAATLTTAMSHLEQTDSPHLVAGCKFRLGDKEAAFVWAEGEKIVNAERFLAQFTPGFLC
ncbi:MAG: AAA family ATPase, partial [Proteobacteria bacterium]|nr:AAA family ATPase [Pseudomonadota bacterium]